MGKKGGGRGRGGGRGKGRGGRGGAPAATSLKVEIHKHEVNDPLVANCNVTGQPANQEQARDLKFVGFSLSSHGVPLIQDTTLELNYGRRYGLIGRNGSGKSTFMRILGARELQIAPHIDIYLLREEVEPTEKTAMQAVIEFGLSEVKRLENLESAIIETYGPESQILMDIYERLDELVSISSPHLSLVYFPHLSLVYSPHFYISAISFGFLFFLLTSSFPFRTPQLSKSVLESSSLVLDSTIRV
jgi:ABC transporter